MEFFKRILVGVDLSRAEKLTVEDLSEPIQNVIERAMWLAGQISAELTFLSVTDLPPASQDLLQDQGIKTFEDAAHKVLNELVAKAESEGIPATSQLAHGKAWEEIIRHVQQQGNDLVIVGTRDAGFASRLLFGSTAIRLLRYCPCPVWVIKPSVNEEADLEILVATDFSDVSQAAVDLGVRAARMTGARLRVLHVLEHYMDRRMQHTGVRDDEIQAYYKNLRREAEQKLHEQLAATDYRTVQAGVIAEVKEGRADIVILDTIEDHKIDLVIMGTIARRGLAGMLIGNTAEILLPQLPCSILAVKPSDFESPIS